VWYTIVVKLDPTSTKPLADQMFERLREAIAVGRYAPGDVLPSIDALAAAANVSANVPRRALVRLAEVGLVEPRRGVGSCVINRRTDATCSGRILCCGPFGGSSSYFDNLALELRQRLFRKNYLLELASTAPGRTARNLLSNMLKHDWDLVLYWDDPKLRELIRTARVRSIVLGDEPRTSDDPNCRGTVCIKNGLALPSFIRACIERGVKRVAQFRFDSDQYDATASFEIAGITMETICLPRPSGAEICARAGYQAVRRFLENRRLLPDVIYFADDHLAQGGLTALLQLGIVPPKVRLVTLANKGVGPVWIQPLTRLETDPVQHGRALAMAILAYFKKGEFPSPLVLGSTWKLGTTF